MVMFKIERRGGVQKSFSRKLPVKILSGPSAAARTGWWTEHRGHMTNYIHVLHFEIHVQN